MTEQTGFAAPDPEQNRAEWLAAHPEAQQATQGEAAAQVASSLGAAAPDPGVSGDDLAAQMAAAGAQPGLPHEDVMNALMDQIRALSDQVGTLQRRDQQREAAALAALGEPILQRYAKGIRDKLAAHEAANPGLGPDHFANVRQTADELVKATVAAVAEGANDLGRVRYHVDRVDRFLTKGHKRLAPSHLAHIDMSAVGQDLEYLVEEADRLTGGAVAIVG
jgi:hypothetical protein